MDEGSIEFVVGITLGADAGASMSANVILSDPTSIAKFANDLAVTALALMMIFVLGSIGIVAERFLPALYYVLSRVSHAPEAGHEHVLQIGQKEKRTKQSTRQRQSKTKRQPRADLPSLRLLLSF